MLKKPSSFRQSRIEGVTKSRRTKSNPITLRGKGRRDFLSKKHNRKASLMSKINSCLENQSFICSQNPKLSSLISSPSKKSRSNKEKSVMSLTSMPRLSSFQRYKKTEASIVRTRKIADSKLKSLKWSNIPKKLQRYARNERRKLGASKNRSFTDDEPNSKAALMKGKIYVKNDRKILRKKLPQTYLQKLKEDCDDEIKEQVVIEVRKTRLRMMKGEDYDKKINVNRRTVKRFKRNAGKSVKFRTKRRSNFLNSHYSRVSEDFRSLRGSGEASRSKEEGGNETEDLDKLDKFELEQRENERKKEEFRVLMENKEKASSDAREMLKSIKGVNFESIIRDADTCNIFNDQQRQNIKLVNNTLHDDLYSYGILGDLYFTEKDRESKIKKVRKKIRKRLELIQRLNISPKRIQFDKIFPTKTYENPCSIELFDAIKIGDEPLARLLIKQNGYLVYDYDYVRILD